MVLTHVRNLNFAGIICIVTRPVRLAQEADQAQSSALKGSLWYSIDFAKE